jgi:hypothetical protein
MTTLQKIIQEIDAMHRTTAAIVNIYIGSGFKKGLLDDWHCTHHIYPIDPMDIFRRILRDPYGLCHTYHFLGLFQPIYHIGSDGVLYRESGATVEALDKAVSFWKGPGLDELLADLIKNNSENNKFLNSIAQ